MTTPAVSVLMAAYNREPYIAAAIESVLAQRFTDFELIVADDCSTDRTRAIAEGYAALDSRVRVVANGRNLGQFPNRNRAAALARAPLLKYHDSDDVLYPYCLDVMVAAMHGAPSAAVGLSHGKAWAGGPCPMVLTPQLAYAREFLGRGVFHCGPGGSIVRKEAFDAVGGFRCDGIHDDYLLWLDLARRFSLVLIPGDLFWYRQHDDQVFVRDRHAWRDNARLHTEIWRALDGPDCPLQGAPLEQARRNQASNVAKLSLRDVKARRFSLALYRMRHAGLSAGDWVRYLRRPRRDPLAGTPLSDRGEFLVPEWTRASTESTRT